MRQIKYGGALISSAEKKAIMSVVNRNWWPLHTQGELMEKEAANYLGVKHGVLANSGSSAGLLALAALELPKGSQVIIPAVTFPTIFNIIVQRGLSPVVVDCELGTYNLTPKVVEDALKKNNIKAIICVHAVGNPCDMPAIMNLAKKYKAYVIEDNCDGWGGSLYGRKIGSYGDISFTSFHAAHIVAMGQGGGVFTNDTELARKVRMYRDWGRQSDIKERRTNGKKWPSLPEDYDSRFIYEKMGYNLSPLELQAAMGRVQLKKTERIKKLRKRNFHYLYKHLSKFPDLRMPHWVDGADPSWFSFPLSSPNRPALVEHLEKNGIETRSMFSGNILRHPGYLHFKWDKKSLPVADEILKQSFWISCHPRLTKEDLGYMVRVFESFYVA